VLTLSKTNINPAKVSTSEIAEGLKRGNDKARLEASRSLGRRAVAGEIETVSEGLLVALNDGLTGDDQVRANVIRAVAGILFHGDNNQTRRLGNEIAVDKIDEAARTDPEDSSHEIKVVEALNNNAFVALGLLSGVAPKRVSNPETVDLLLYNLSQKEYVDYVAMSLVHLTPTAPQLFQEKEKTLKHKFRQNKRIDASFTSLTYCLAWMEDASEEHLSAAETADKFVQDDTRNDQLRALTLEALVLYATRWKKHIAPVIELADLVRYALADDRPLVIQERGLLLLEACSDVDFCPSEQTLDVIAKTTDSSDIRAIATDLAGRSDGNRLLDRLKSVGTQEKEGHSGSAVREEIRDADTINIGNLYLTVDSDMIGELNVT
jgi:hypothetical protein